MRSGPPVPRRKRRKFASMPNSASTTPSISATTRRRFRRLLARSLGYYVQGAIEETQTLRWYAEAINAACERDIEVAESEVPRPR